MNPTTPQNAAGMRTEPAPSVPMPATPMPIATAAAAPPLDPPALRARSHGLRVGGTSWLRVEPLQPDSEVFVLPSTTAPARRSRSTTGGS